ncbi:hypothetical protein [Streptococcus marimammalium]|nr:hypothetical protein [Streptococcus marimammalium]
MLITDKNDDISNAFYQSLGFSKDLDGYPLITILEAEQLIKLDFRRVCQ